MNGLKYVIDVACSIIHNVSTVERQQRGGGEKEASEKLQKT